VSCTSQVLVWHGYDFSCYESRVRCDLSTMTYVMKLTQSARVLRLYAAHSRRGVQPVRWVQSKNCGIQTWSRNFLAFFWTQSDKWKCKYNGQAGNEESLQDIHTRSSATAETARDAHSLKSHSHSVRRRIYDVVRQSYGRHRTT